MPRNYGENHKFKDLGRKSRRNAPYRRTISLTEEDIDRLVVLREIYVINFSPDFRDNISYVISQALQQAIAFCLETGMERPTEEEKEQINNDI